MSQFVGHKYFFCTVANSVCYVIAFLVGNQIMTGVSSNYSSFDSCPHSLLFLRTSALCSHLTSRTQCILLQSTQDTNWRNLAWCVSAARLQGHISKLGSQQLDEPCKKHWRRWAWSVAGSCAGCVLRMYFPSSNVLWLLFIISNDSSLGAAHEHILTNNYWSDQHVFICCS